MPEFAHLIDGYQRFRNNAYRDQKERWDALAHEGQAPPVMVIACCDSRVDPATVFDTVPGQVFSLRNVANLVPPYEVGGGKHGASAAIEFGVLGLKVRHIVVLGHAQCGGIQAALHGYGKGQSDQHSFIGDWMGIIADACGDVIASAPANPQRALELEAIKVSLTNLRSFPFIAEREASGSLKLHGAYFGIADGVLHVLNETNGHFEAM
ncbi:MAG: carbonic anhydrase [Sphingomonadaceae bacterium]